MEKRIFIISVFFLTIFTTCNSVKPKEFGSLPHQNVEISSVGLESKRDKREVSDISSSNKSQPSSSNSSSIQSSQAAVNLTRQQTLVGVNGTGQLLNVSSTTESILAPTISTKKMYNGAPIDTEMELPDDELYTNVSSINDEEIEKNLKTDANVTKNFKISEDHHIYYNSTVTVNKEQADAQWESIKYNQTISTLLSKSHRRAMTIQLSFDFPFYGHAVRNVTVATGGFLYTGDHVHSWLAATQYIAPLMANFDTSISNESYVRYSDNGTAFTVIWENVKLQDKNEGPFTFSATLYRNGNITFVYYNVPHEVNQIQDDKHPVKVGLSDAYIIDKTIFFARRKTIYEYHRVTFDTQKIQNNTVIHLIALDTCLSFLDCQACTSATIALQCRWCPAINRCSTGTDRRRQEWMHKGCDTTKIDDEAKCPELGKAGNNYNASTELELLEIDKQYNTTGFTEDSKKLTIPSQGTQGSRINDRKLNLGEHDQLSLIDHKDGTEEGGVGTLVGVFIPIALVLSIVCWIFYAYRNPHTKSGQLLIQYRPSQWSWRRGEARYTAATIHM